MRKGIDWSLIDVKRLQALFSENGSLTVEELENAGFEFTAGSREFREKKETHSLGEQITTILSNSHVIEKTLKKKQEKEKAEQDATLRKEVKEASKIGMDEVTPMVRKTAEDLEKGKKAVQTSKGGVTSAYTTGNSNHEEMQRKYNEQRQKLDEIKSIHEEVTKRVRDVKDAAKRQGQTVVEMQKVTEEAVKFVKDSAGKMSKLKEDIESLASDVEQLQKDGECTNRLMKITKKEGEAIAEFFRRNSGGNHNTTAKELDNKTIAKLLRNAAMVFDGDARASEAIDNGGKLPEETLPNPPQKSKPKKCKRRREQSQQDTEDVYKKQFKTNRSIRGLKPNA